MILLTRWTKNPEQQTATNFTVGFPKRKLAAGLGAILLTSTKMLGNLSLPVNFTSYNDSYSAFDFASTYANKVGAILYGYVGTDNGNVFGRTDSNVLKTLSLFPAAAHHALLMFSCVAYNATNNSYITSNVCITIKSTSRAYQTHRLISIRVNQYYGHNLS